MGDEAKPAQHPLRNSTESDDPHNGKSRFHHNSDSISGYIRFEWDGEEPPHPFRCLDLPLETQLDVVDILSELYENCGRMRMHLRTVWVHPSRFLTVGLTPILRVLDLTTF